MKSFDRRFLGLVMTAIVAAQLLSDREALAASPPSAADAALFERLDADHDGQIMAGEVTAENERLFARLLRRADINGDKALSRDEFIAGLVPTRPEKPLEEKQPTSFPQADALRWILLTMDADGNSRIDEKEVPERLVRVFDSMANRIDANKDRVLDRRELNQGGPQLAQIAGRYMREEGIEASAELERLEKKLGASARRFDVPPPRLENLSDPEQARQLFVQLDTNGNGQIEKKEVTGPLERPFERLMRAADRNDDGQLSEREFLAGARQIARRQGRQATDSMPASESKPSDAMPAEKAMPADGK